MPYDTHKFLFDTHGWTLPPVGSEHRKWIVMLHKIKKACNKLTLFDLPYGSPPSNHPTPLPEHPHSLDCSAAITWIMERAGYKFDHTYNSVDFLKFATEGKGKHVTIWTKGPVGPTGHTFIEVDGKFLSTGVNDHRGPALTDHYNTAGYTPRHPKGL